MSEHKDTLAIWETIRDSVADLNHGVTRAKKYNSATRSTIKELNDIKDLCDELSAALDHEQAERKRLKDEAEHHEEEPAPVPVPQPEPEPAPDSVTHEGE